MSPRKPPEPDPPPAKPGRGSIPPSVARRMEDRSEAFGRATSRAQGKPWSAGTYGHGQPLTDKERKDRAKAIRDAKAAAERAAGEADPLE